MLDQAIAYSVRGWAVLPLHRIVGGVCSCGNDCSSPGKHPVASLVPNGLSNASRDEKQIIAWWQDRPWNIGIATGTASGIVVLDVDAKSGGMESLEEIQGKHGKLVTLSAYTGGGGQHFFFRHPGYQVSNSANRVAKGIDVRGDGGYVVAPPSSHASGDSYEWVDMEVPLAPMPAFVSPEPVLAKDYQPQAVEGKIPQGERNVTMISVAGSMRRRGLPKNVILAALSEMNATMTEKPIPAWELDRIVESICRYAPGEVITGIDDVIEEYDEDGPQATRMDDLMQEVHKSITDRMEAGGGLLGASFGFRKLDDMTGGAEKGDLIVIGARPSMGKTAFAIGVSKTMGYHQRVAVFSAEMSQLALGYRYVSMESGIEGIKLRRGLLSEKELSDVTMAAGRIAPLDIWVSDKSSITPRGIRRTLRSIDKAHGPVGAVFVDYLQLMSSDHKHGSREEAVASVSRELKQIALEFDLPVIALAQLNRNVEGRRDKRPGLADFRESGQIEQDIDLGMFLHRAEYYGDETVNVNGMHVPADGVAELIIAKQRNGPIGEVFLRFDDETATFSEYTTKLRADREAPDHYTPF